MIVVRLCVALLVLALLPGHAAAAHPALIPMPSSVEWHDGDFRLAGNTVVQAQGDAAATATFLSRALGLKTGARGGPRIELILVSEKVIGGQEAYRLKVSGRQVRIEASHPDGLFYGAQTLLQLV